MRTSYSSLQTYKQCPQKYKFQEIDRIRSKKSKEAVFGTIVHSALKFMFEQTPLFPTVDEVLEYYRNSFTDAAKSSFADENIFRAYYDEGLRMLKNFYSKNAPWNYAILDLESRFEVPIIDEKRGETHILSGKIDRIDKIADGSYEIIDYKTSKRLPSQDTVDHDLQLSIYGLGVGKKWPHIRPDAVKVSLYFLKHGEKITSARSEDALKATRDDVLKTISQIQEKLEQRAVFEPTPSPHGGICIVTNNQQPTTNNRLTRR